MVCQLRSPQPRHRMYDLDVPRAFQRMPPMSQIDLSKPHRQRIIHWRETASMLRPQLAGKMAMKNLWIKLIRASTPPSGFTR